jgi:hypothetical protein
MMTCSADGAASLAGRLVSSPASITALLRTGARRSRLGQLARKTERWLWDGYLGRGQITLLTSQWKSGKTTLISVLMAKMGGGGELAGMPVAAGKVAIITEEGPDNWDTRCENLKMGEHVTFFCRPFRGKPRLEEWQCLMDALLQLKAEEGLGLVVIDPLVSFLPGRDENHAGSMMECLLPLADLTAAGLSVLLVHHPRKGRVIPGQASRGSGALPSHIDILMEMNWFGEIGDDDRRRRIKAYSRHQETCRNLVLELSADGTDYRACDPSESEETSECSQALRRVLESASERLTQKQILEEWPEDCDVPIRSTLSRTLKRGLQAETIKQKGRGIKSDPFLYWLAEKEESIRPDDDATPDEIARWEEKLRQEVMSKCGIVTEPEAKEEAEPAEQMDEQASGESTPTGEADEPVCGDEAQAGEQYEEEEEDHPLRTLGESDSDSTMSVEAVSRNGSAALIPKSIPPPALEGKSAISPGRWGWRRFPWEG